MKKVYVGILICLVIVIVSAGCGKKYMQEADDTDWEQGTVQNITDAQSCYVNNKVADDGYGIILQTERRGNITEFTIMMLAVSRQCLYAVR